MNILKRLLRRKQISIDDYDTILEEIAEWKPNLTSPNMVEVAEIDLSDEDKENIEAIVRVAAAMSKKLELEVAIVKHKKGYDFRIGKSALVECPPRCIPVEYWLHIHPGAGSSTGPSSLDRHTQRAWGERRIQRYLLANQAGDFLLDWSEMPTEETPIAEVKMMKFADYDENHSPNRAWNR